MTWLRDNNTHLNKPLPLFETAEGLEIKRLEAKITELESRLPTPSLSDIKADAVKKFGAWFVSSRHMRSTTTDVDEVASLYARLLSKGDL